MPQTTNGSITDIYIYIATKSRRLTKIHDIMPAKHEIMKLQNRSRLKDYT